MSSNNIKDHTVTILVVIITLSLFSSLTLGSNDILAKKHKIHQNKDSQKINLDQSTNQNLDCGLPGSIVEFCSNQNSQNGINSGKNMINQLDARHSSNSIEQGIGLDQSTNQNLDCGLPGSIVEFCSNQSSQNEIDTGDNTSG
jgi:Na+-transporting NADH:ubiquinone oxidoreductase subunit NqrC